MDYCNKKYAGTLLFIGAVQCVLGILISEALYPGYSTSIQTISSLGIGPSAIIFNSSVFLIGILGLAATYFIYQEFKSNMFTALSAMTHNGTVGVGIFTEANTTFTIHVIFSVITYLFGGMAVIMAYKVQKQPLSILSAILGVFSITAMVLLALQIYLGLGLGGMERMVAYPLLLWEVSLGTQLISQSSKQTVV